MTAITAQRHGGPQRGTAAGRRRLDGARRVGAARTEDFTPSLYHDVSHLHIAVSWFIAATGIAVFVLVWFGVRCALLALSPCLSGASGGLWLSSARGLRRASEA